MKRIFAVVLMLIIAAGNINFALAGDEIKSQTAYALEEDAFIASSDIENVEMLPAGQPFCDVLCLDDINDIERGVIVRKDGKCADIEADDLKKWLEVYWNFSNYERVIAPVKAYVFDDYYIKIYSSDNESFTVYSNSGVITGTFGKPVDFGGVTRENYVWYLPYVGNGRNALYMANNKLFEKYLNESSQNFSNNLRDADSNDAVEIPQNNLLNTQGSGSWAKEEIEKAAALNLVVYELTEKLDKAITRKEFSYLIYKLIATDVEPNNDSRMGEWSIIDGVIDQRGLRKKFDSVIYNDCDDEKIKFLTAAGIVKGTGAAEFSPDESLTREQAATILYRTALFLGVENIPSQLKGIHFKDKDDISSWAETAVAAMYEMSVMKGISDDEFSPLGVYTTQQSIATVLRLYESKYYTRQI